MFQIQKDNIVSVYNTLVNGPSDQASFLSRGLTDYGQRSMSSLPPNFVNEFCWNTVMSSLTYCLWLFSCQSQWKSVYQRNSISHKAKNIYCLNLQRKSVWISSKCTSIYAVKPMAIHPKWDKDCIQPSVDSGINLQLNYANLWKI